MIVLSSFTSARGYSTLGLEELETRNILVIGVWAFAIVWLVGMFVLQADLFFALILFFVAIFVSFAATALPSNRASGDSKSHSN